MSLISEGANFRGPLTAGAGLVEPSLASVGDYVALMKPRVMSLVVFTALLCIAVGAGAAGALNMWYDADIDAVMTRTARRPVPMGRVQPATIRGVSARRRWSGRCPRRRRSINSRRCRGSSRAET